MPDTLISEIFNVKQRFLRSANLERDFADPSALRGYVVTPHAEGALQRLLQGLKHGSGQRAWRITGDYGSGKSSFGLLLAHLFAGGNSELPPEIRRKVKFSRLGIPSPKMLPMLVTGTREPLGLAVIRSLHQRLEGIGENDAVSTLSEKVKGYIELSEISPVSDQTVIGLIAETVDVVINENLGSGLLIILDELGKFLEFSALHPERQDVFLLQRLAETASRSGEKPIFIVGLLHQGFSAMPTCYLCQHKRSGKKLRAGTKRFYLVSHWSKPRALFLMLLISR